MLVKILRPFTYSADGIRGRVVATGEVVDVRDAYVAGLDAEGFVTPAPAGMRAPETAPDDPAAPAAPPAPAARKVKAKFGRFDVIDAEGQKRNTKMLSEADADAMIASLAAGG